MEPKTGITFYGGTGSVTGANFLIDIPNGNKSLKILVDCGMFQGEKTAEERNRENFPYDPSEIDHLFVTHAHLDHIGRIPKLVKEGFSGPIHSTEPARDIAMVMLEDSAGVLRSNARDSEKEPLYTKEDARKSFAHWIGHEYHREVQIADGISAEFYIAGHTLGSSLILFNIRGKKVLFTGDLGNEPTPLLRDVDPMPEADYLVMESVYGDRNHEDRDKRKKVLRDTIKRTIDRRGVLMIPVFSLERTQEILYEIEGMVERGEIESVPIFVDSPLAIKITDIYKRYSNYFNEKVRGIIEEGNKVFKFPNLKFTKTSDESKAINRVPAPKIILAGSGMSSGGRILHHEKHYLGDKNNTLLFVGFQAVGTLGRIIQGGAKKVRIHNEQVKIKAEIVTVHGYSGHMDGENLLKFVEEGEKSLKKVFMVMGEPKSSIFLAQRVQDYLGIDTRVPEEGEVFYLE